MPQFDILEIQKNIEEKRLILGKKFEDFLLRNLKSFLQKADQFFCSKNFCFWSVSVVFLLSIYLRSRLDIGSGSAYLVDKIFYYKFFQISPIILVEIFINFLGISSLIISTLILSGSALNQVHKNILITSFAIGFFLPINALGLNEFFTKTNFLLFFTYPYIAFSFARKVSLSQKEMLFRGLMGGLMPCINPSHIFLLLIIEADRFWRKKSLKFFIEIDKIVIFGIAIFYFIPNFFLVNLFENLSLKILFFGGIFLVFLRQKFSADDKVLFLIFFATSLILLVGNRDKIDQEALFLGLIIPVFATIFYDFLKSEQLRVGKEWLACAFVLLLAITVPSSFCILEKISVFWWVIIPILAANLLAKFRSEQIKINQKIINYLAVPAFVLLLAIGFAVMLKNSALYLFFSTALMLLFLILYEKNYAKFYKNFSAFFVFVQFFLAATLISLVSASVFEAYVSGLAGKSPNYLTNQIIRYGKFYAAKSEDKILILSNKISDVFPMTIYSDKKDLLTFFPSDLQNKNTQLIFVNNDAAFSGKDRCSIGLIEQNFQDQKFRKTFLKNYKFIGRIFMSEVIENSDKVTFFAKEEWFEKLDLTRSRPVYDFEIYARKNN